MAGDWIKMRSDLLTHPKVVRISSALKVDRLRTIGALFAAWCLFDAHSEDGTLPGYTDSVLNEMVGLKGFASAMRDVGWLQFNDDGLSMPEFEEHNGKSAKIRAEDAKRKRKDRTNVREIPDKKQTDSGPEKRREEKKVNTPPPPDGVDETVWQDFLKLRKAKKAPVTDTAIDGIRREADKAGMTLADALAMCCKRGWQGFDADWVKDKSGPNQFAGAI